MRITRITLLLFLGIGACRGDRAPVLADPAVIGGPPERPIITPSQATLRVGDSVRFVVAAIGNPALPVQAIWSSLGPDIAQVDSIAGVVRARSAGVTAIKAVLVSDATQSAAVLVRVSP